MTATEDFANEADQILDEAFQKLATLISKRYNETCACPEVHEVAISAWAVTYEQVDMREGGHPGTKLEVAHSTPSFPHAHGLLSVASEIVKARELGHHLRHDGE